MKKRNLKNGYLVRNVNMVANQQSDHKHMENLLLMCLTNIGDGVLLSPCISALSYENPKLNIILVAKPSVCDLYAKDTRVKGFIKYTCSWFPGPNGTHDGVSGFLRTLGLIRSFQCKTALNTSGDIRTNLLARMGGIKNLVVAKSRGGNFLANSVVAMDTMFTHESDRLLLLAENFLQKPIVRYPLKVEISNEDIENAKMILGAYNLEGKFLIAIHPGANVEFKEWPINRYIELGKKIVKRGDCKIFVLGAPGREAELAKHVSDSIGSEAYNLGGKTPLRTLLALLGIFTIYIGNDSGPMHMAAAAGCPSIAIFGATNHVRFGPRVRNNIQKTFFPSDFEFDQVEYARTIGFRSLCRVSVESIYDGFCHLISLITTPGCNSDSPKDK